MFDTLPDDLRTSLGTADEQSKGGSDDDNPTGTKPTVTEPTEPVKPTDPSSEPTGPKPGEGGEPPKPFTLDGKEYDEKALEGIVREHQNNENWEKTNTQNAQATAAQAKAIKTVLEVVEKITSDKDAVEILQDYGYKLSKEDIQQARKAAAEAEPTKPKEDTGTQDAAGDEVGKLKERLDQVEAERQFERDLLAFTKKDDDHREVFDTSEKVNGFVKFMVDNGISDMDKAFGLYTAEQRAEAAEKALEEAGGKKRSPNAPLGKGARKIKTDFKPVTGDFGMDAAREASRKLLGID